MSITLQEAVKKMTGASQQVPELIGKVADVISDCSKELLEMVQLTEDVNRNVTALDESLAKQQNALLKRTEEQEKQLTADLHGLTDEVVSLLKQIEKYEEALSQQTDSVLKASESSAGALKTTQQQIAALEQSQSQVVETGLTSLRQSQTRFMEGAARLAAEFTALQSESDRNSQDVKAQFAALEQAITQAKANWRNDIDVLGEEAKKAVTRLNASMNSEVKTRATPAVQAIVGRATGALKEQVEDAAKRAMAELSTSLRETGSALKSLEANVAVHSKNMSKGTATYTNAKDLRAQVEASKEVLAKIGKLHLLR